LLQRFIDKRTGCSFINVLLEIDDPHDSVHDGAVRHLSNIRSFLRLLAEEAGVSDPNRFARRWTS
jgi:hypothetical protein